MKRRRICYVTGTRAEFGLMCSTLRAIAQHPKLELQLLATGMHLSRAHGRTIEQIRREGFAIDATVPWREARSGDALAQATGSAMAGMARALAKLDPEIVLVCGDRVEPFAAASAAHLGGRAVAHVHGGDRALGQVDDALRHAISKLAHLHLCATSQSAERLFKMGEDRFRIRRVGTPGVDDLPKRPRSIGDNPAALFLLHPESGDDEIEYRRAGLLIDALRRSPVGRVVVLHPNNDPGWRGIARAINEIDDRRFTITANLDRRAFLSLLAGAAMLAGNSSSGIIEAAGVGTMAINVGDRQKGRQRSANIIDVPWSLSRIGRAVESIWNNGSPKRFHGRNVYGGGDAGTRVARILSDVKLDEKLLRKLIRY